MLFCGCVMFSGSGNGKVALPLALGRLSDRADPVAPVRAYAAPVTFAKPGRTETSPQPYRNMNLRVLDLDGSLTGQPEVAALHGDGRAALVDLRDAGPGLRVIATARGVRGFTERIDAACGPPNGKTDVFFYGSGDFHHITAALVARVPEPVTVVHFDNHPDWCRYPKTFNCGGWVSRALDMAHVQRVVTIGPSSGDFVRPELQTADLGALRTGRLEVYPWRAEPSRVWRKYPDTPCSRTADGHIHWRNLHAEDWSGFLDELTARLPATPLWITIDKDVLGADEATANWDQGEMKLDDVIAAVERLAGCRRVVGIDVCGEYSAPVFADRFRAAIANFDNPPGPAPSAERLAINAATNARLIAAFERVFG